MLLVDYQIKEEIESGRVVIDPYDENLINPSSLDVRLGKRWGKLKISGRYLYMGTIPCIDLTNPDSFDYEYLDSPEYLLQPNEFVLAEMMEHLKLPDNLSAVVKGKSSLARLGIGNSHQAGFIDPGWEGTIALEIYNYTNKHVILKEGMKIGQLVFYPHLSVKKPYRVSGRYMNQSSELGSKGVLPNL